MAKRVRGNRSTHRPGGQGPSRSDKTPDASSSASDGISQAMSDEVDAAFDSSGLVMPQPAQPLAQEPAAPPTSKSGRSRRRSRTKGDGLAARAAVEDVWVGEDLRRIGIVSAILVAALAIAWVLFVLMDVLGLY